VLNESLDIYIYIYIYRERERDIYIYIYKHTGRLHISVIHSLIPIGYMILSRNVPFLSLYERQVFRTRFDIVLHILIFFVSK
jgi:hypothetical protein